MDSLTARQKFILNNLMEKGPLTLRGLSQQIDVSERTILRETSVLNDWLKQYKIRISDHSGKLHINGNNRDLDKVRKSLEEIPHLWMLTQEQRQVLITAQLLLADEPIKSAYFSHQFNVVGGTIVFYLDKIESWLKLKNLNLIRKRGYGLEIEGSDWNKRNAFVDLIYSYKSISELLAFLYEDNNDYLLLAFFKVTFGEGLINKTRNLLKKIEANHLLKNDIGFFSTFIHLLLSIKRTESNLPIELPDQLVRDILSSNESWFVKKVQEVLEESNIELPDSELAYLAIHLNGDRKIDKDENEAKELGFELGDLIREVIYFVEKKLNIKIEGDNQLLLGLAQHINPALYRLTMGLEVRNPIINEIKQYYQNLYEAVDYACKLVFSKYNLTIPANEVGYITMHIGAAIERQHGAERKLNILIICPNGISTAKMLCNKLSSKFPELNRIDVCSLREMNEKINEGYDLVFSTVNIDKKQNGDIAVISPFLPTKDIDEISSLIKSKFTESNSLKKNILPLFAEKVDDTEEDFNMANNMLKNFQLKMLAADNYQDTIKEIVNEIYHFHLMASKDTIKYLIDKREEKGNVIIPGSHIALIHFRTDEIDTPFVGVYKLKHFIEMKSVGFSFENVDTFLVMLARKNESNYILEQLGKISVSLVENASFAEILRFGDLKDIRNELIEILNREEY